MSIARLYPELVQNTDVLPIIVPRKDEIKPNADLLVTTLLEAMSAKDAYVYVYARIAVEESALEALAEKAIIGLEGKSETIFGATLSTRSKPAQYIYSDPKLDRLKAELENLKTAIKERETFNKSIPEEGTADPETGEIIHRPVKNEQGVTIAVKLA